MMDKPLHIHYDRSGLLRVGAASVALDDIIAAHHNGDSGSAILAAFPGLSVEELQAALDYHLAEGADGIDRVSNNRDAHWRQWNVTVAEEMGTDIQPSHPVQPLLRSP